MYPVRQQTSGLAIASLVCGLIGCLSHGMAAIPGLMLGIMAVKEIDRSGGMKSGREMAMAGIILSAIEIVLFTILLILGIAIFSIFGSHIVQPVVDLSQPK